MAKKRKPLKGLGPVLALAGLGGFLYYALRPKTWRVTGADGYQDFNNELDAQIAYNALNESGIPVSMVRV